MAAHDQEELLNGKLADLLREQGLDARPERREAVKDADARPVLRAAPQERTER